MTTRHLLGLRAMPKARILGLLEAAASYLPVAMGQSSSCDALQGHVIANLFLENSTRTRVSFTMAAQRLGATTVDLLGSTSSASKGETLIDTGRNIEAMGVAAIVLRTSASGGAHLLARHVGVPVINAGDGRSEHPTQGLLDTMALTEHLGTTDLEGRTIGIVGDIAHSRVARSAAYALTTLGADVIFIGPPAMVPGSMTELVPHGEDGHTGLHISHDLDAALPHLDAVMMLRVQFERGASITADYAAHFGMNAARANRMPPHACIMHPGPINRGLELTPEVADGPRSVILRQVTCGVAMRMAVLCEQLAHE